MRWRALLDCKRNSVSMLAQAHFAPERLHGVDAATVLRMLREEKQVEWEKEPAFFRYGAYVKKEQYDKPAFNPKTQQEGVTKRTRAAARSFELDPEEARAFLLARFWPGPGPGPGVACK
jgi:tRNA(His) 5'-end guanylyltransferase